jgi:tRNA pseudouridine55 synthase
MDEPIDVVSLADSARATFPVRELTADEARALSYGQSIGVADGGPAATVAGIDPAGELVALLEERGGVVRPALVFAPA